MSDKDLGLTETKREATMPRIEATRNARQAKSVRAGDWFGCGRVITTESWEGFKKARADYYRRVDEAKALGTPNDPLLGHPRPQ
jgi:hypothetical protein